MRLWPQRLSLVLVFVPVLAAQDPFRQAPPKAPPEVDQALRSRVTQYYTLYQQGKYRQSEAYIEPEGRDAYYAIRKNTIYGFEVKDLQFAPDFQSAKVTVACQTTVAIQTSGSRMTLPVFSQWKLIDGEWYASMGPAQGESVNTPFGKMTFDGSRAASKAPDPGATQLATANTLAKMFKLTGRRVLRFRADAKEPVTQTIVLSNTGQGTLELRREFHDIPGLEVATDPVEIANGQDMKISFTYKPEVARLEGRKKLEFTVLPINQAFVVTAQFDNTATPNSKSAAKAKQKAVQ
jgi:hypothetical protein